MNIEQQITQNIMDEKQLESDAIKARAFLKELAELISRMEKFANATGASPQDPVEFCRRIILSYGMNNLDRKIVTLQ